LLAAESIAVQVTVFVPRPKALPDAGVELVVTVPQLSLAVGAPNGMFTCVWGRVILVTISAGQVICGSSLSLIVTLNGALGDAGYVRRDDGHARQARKKKYYRSAD